LGKKAELLAPLFQECRKFTEKEKLKELKDKKASMPKVNRENKYIDKKTQILKTTLCVLSAATIGAVSTFSYLATKLNKSAQDIINENDFPDISVSDVYDNSNQSLEFINNEITNQDVEMDDKTEKEGIFIEYEDLSEAKRALKTKEKYGELIEKYATMYGLDPNLMIAIAIQERGEHSSIMDKGGATGIMQMQNGVWIGEKISAYNYETEKKDSFIVTKDNIGDLETNIQMGCMCFQNNLEYYDYNIPLAIQAYNYGMGKFKQGNRCLC